MGLIEAANARGTTIKGQVLPRPIGMLFGLELSLNPFTLKPSYKAIKHLPLSERVQAMRNPDVRARILSEESEHMEASVYTALAKFDEMYEMASVPDYEPRAEDSLGARARQVGTDPATFVYDRLVTGDGRTTFFMPFANYADNDLNAVETMFTHKDFVLGLGDGGAHCGMICDASYTTYMLAYWTRDRTRGARHEVAEVVKALTHDTATSVGLCDRGIIAAGFRADLNIIDYDRLTIHQPEIHYDLPAGGKRLNQQSTGYVATIVNGKTVYRNGVPTGALPGKLVRGHQPEPA